MKKRKIGQAVIIFTLLLVPALYALIFLGAYWNPASHMTNIPVAVVNCDRGYVAHGKTSNIGSELVDTLKSNDNVKWIFTDKDDAEEGIKTQRYYAVLIIPENFTENISSATSETKTQGILYFKSNDKAGLMVSTMLSSVSSNIETSICQTISESIVEKITTQLIQLPASIKKLSDGLGKLESGSNKLQEGMSTLVKGQTAFNGGLNSLTTGLDTANQGSDKLKAALNKLSEKTSLFATGMNSSISATDAIASASEKYTTGFSSLSSSLNEYLTTSSKQIQNSINIVTYLQSYIAEHPDSTRDANIQAIISGFNSSNSSQSQTADSAEITKTLSDSLNKLNELNSQINTAIQQMPDRMETAADGANALSKALEQVYNGSASLSSGLDSASQGANTLSRNSESILAGETQIDDGLTQLVSGVELLKNSVDSSILELTGSTSALEGLGKFVAQPVEVESTKIGEAENTGTALAPFMLSLCLYIGSMMIMITIFTMDKLKFYETRIAQKIKIDFGLFRYQIIGIFQAILIAFTVHIILGLHLQSVIQFYSICILGSLAFTTLIQVLVMLFKSFGKLLTLLFMMCQLTAGGGVLPTVILPDFYKSIHPYMPMTYTINALRNVILSFEPDNYHNSIIVLLGISVISALIVILLSYMDHKKVNTQDRQILPITD